MLSMLESFQQVLARPEAARRRRGPLAAGQKRREKLVYPVSYRLTMLIFFTCLDLKTFRM